MKNIIISVALAALSAGSASAQVAGDPIAGAKSFGQCRACHSAVKGAKNGIGPNLFGVYGTRAGAQPANYAFSSALKGSKIIWNDATLDTWLTDPAAMVKGTKMSFVGIPRKPVRQNIIAYLKTLK